MADSKKKYLGDAVYVDVDCYGRFVLTTEDGISVTNVIVLETKVAASLVGYLQRLREDATSTSKEDHG